MEQCRDHLAALRAGNAEATRAWVAQYAPKVRDVGLAYLGDTDEAAALTKQVFAQALQAIRTGYTPVDTEDWLLSLARAQGSQAVLAKPAKPLPAQTPQPILRPAPTIAEAPPMPEEYAMPEAYGMSEAYGMREAFDTLQAWPALPPDADLPNMPASFDAHAIYEEPAPPQEPKAPAQDIDPTPEPEMPVPVLLYDDEEEDVLSLFEDEPIVRRNSPFKRFFGALLILILLSAVLALVWGLLGLMMRLRMIPAYDLGYSWFNANIHPFF